MITYEPITEIRPDRDVLRCLPESAAEKQALLEKQAAFGIGAFEDGIFVGSVWFYWIAAADSISAAPEWSGWHQNAAGFAQVRAKLARQAYPILGLDCFHVGRTKAFESENRNDENYFRKGIGTNLLENAIFWAQTHEIKTVIAYSGIDSFPEFNLWSGRLPLKVYIQHAFQVFHSQEAIQNIPWHLQDFLPAADSAKMKMAIVARTL